MQDRSAASSATEIELVAFAEAYDGPTPILSDIPAPDPGKDDAEVQVEKTFIQKYGLYVAGFLMIAFFTSTGGSGR